MATSAQDLRQSLSINNNDYDYYSIAAAEAAGLGDFSQLPRSLKVILENLLRNLDGHTVTTDDIQAVNTWLKDKTSQHEIAYRPARVLMQDFTGVPAVVDLAAMRDAMVALKGNAEKINPLIPVDLVIDHSVQVDSFASSNAFKVNVEREMERNFERYQFLRWGQQAFSNFRVVPPGTGICHQVNLEHLAKVVWSREDNGRMVAYPDTLVGTDSHTTMINGLGVLGWGVGGIEAEAAMLGQPISMVIPEVIGVKLTGTLKEGIIATDLVLTITEMLRKRGVVGKFVEFFGPGLEHLPLADRATISNMAPEYGATCGFFPVDDETLNYMKLTGRSQETIELVEAYTKAMGLWRDEAAGDPVFTDTLALDLASVEPSLAGPKRPQDRVVLSKLGQAFDNFLDTSDKGNEKDLAIATKDADFDLRHGDVVIAAITSCTNTSNPSALMAAGLVAKKAIEKGLKRKPWVKSSLAPGSKVVTDYLEKAGLQDYLDKLGFNLVGYGCTTCIGNSGPLPDPVAGAITEGDLVVSSVLSGNRNFEGRVHPLVKANWLASPPLVVAFALAGTTRIDLASEPVGQDADGNDVYLKDIWPSNQEVADEVNSIVTEEMFRTQYADVFAGDADWQAIQVTASNTYAWNSDSTYVQHPPFFEGITPELPAVKDIAGARILALLGDSITTDHISPAGAIKSDSPAGKYLQEHNVSIKDFNSYGSRRGNHNVMMRGTFANIRIRNEMVKGVEGGYTKYIPSGETLSIYDAAMKYQQDGTPLVVVAGKEYGTGSSRDWAAKGTLLLGVKAVITESYERIHRSNLIGMGVIPLEFKDGVNRKSLGLDGSETVDIIGLEAGLSPRMDVKAIFHKADGSQEEVTLLCRIDTEDELGYIQNGGILQTVLRDLAKS
ncbi:MAG: aconitate hydratase AcnA [Legionellales bacterium]|nr:aconitate hydratase AcnA [Legionellales bacterium]|tara:strand:+ start:25752 stop:28430 length:2679 start_codon:yes stop_codon:yes gene_type:complete